MTQEEKAKAYDEAVKEASIAYKDEDKHLKATLERIFPELKESEDERIRKWLIAQLEIKIGDNATLNNMIYKAIAWLEKQGQKPQGKSALEAINEEKIDNQNFVKPTDKVEPKFHEGVWLTENHPNNYARFVQILEIVNVQGKKRYRISRDLHNDEDVVECLFIEDYWHHFNIQDAKDGDVLHSPFHRLIWIYKDNKHYYACVNMNYVTENVATEGLISIPNDACPATKEEQTILFARMKEAGYEWDADKKELRKEEVK